MSPDDSDGHDLSVPTNPTNKKRSLRLLGSLIVIVVTAQLLNLGLQWLQPPAPPQLLDNPSMLADRRAPTFGAANADVTIYLFSDYACPVCRAMSPDLIKLVASDKGLRIVYRDWPVLSPRSIRAARLAIASKSTGRHAAFDAEVMRHGGSLDDATLHLAATRAGIDWNGLLKDYARDQREIDDLIAQSGSYAHALGFSGTPTLVIGPFLVVGRQSLERLRELVAQARGGLRA